MKKTFLIYAIIAASILALAANVSAQTCSLEATMINQDPYPAVPGENVKVVFQIKGVDNSDCREIRVSFKDSYPFSLDPASQRTISVQGGIFARDYPSFLIAPYTLRTAKDATEGENKISLEIFNQKTRLTQVKDFFVEVKEVKTEFEVFIRNYDRAEGLLTLEIINIGKNDVESLVVELPSQQTVQTKGSNRQTIGILDSNEDTTTRFSTSGAREGSMEVKLMYNDQIGERREIVKNIQFNPDNFDAGNNSRDWSVSTYLLIALVAAIAIYWIYSRRQKRKLREKRKLS
jgi:hypothetical protein